MYMGWKLNCISLPTLSSLRVPPSHALAFEFYSLIETEIQRGWRLRLLSLVLGRPFSSGPLLFYEYRTRWLCWRVGGLTAGIALKQQLGFHNFKVLISVRVIQLVLSTQSSDIRTIQRHWRDVACEWTHILLFSAALLTTSPNRTTLILYVPPSLPPDEIVYHWQTNSGLWIRRRRSLVQSLFRPEPILGNLPCLSARNKSILETSCDQIFSP